MPVIPVGVRTEVPAHVHGIESDPFALVEGLIDKIRGYRSKLTWIAIPAFLWFSTRLFGSLRSVLADVFDPDLVVIGGGLAGTCAAVSGPMLIRKMASFCWRLSFVKSMSGMEGERLKD